MYYPFRRPGREGAKCSFTSVAQGASGVHRLGTEDSRESVWKRFTIIRATPERRTRCIAGDHKPGPKRIAVSFKTGDSIFKCKHLFPPGTVCRECICMLWVSNKLKTLQDNEYFIDLVNESRTQHIQAYTTTIESLRAIQATVQHSLEENRVIKVKQGAIY